MPTPKPKKDLTAFRAAHDKNVIVPKKIRGCFEEMKKTGDAFEYDADFMKRAKISPAEISAFREQFAAHIVQTTGKNPKRAWFHDPKTAKAATDAIG